MGLGISEEYITKLKNLFSNNPKIKEAVVFGSRAKGTNKPGSDIDIALKGENIELDDILNLSVAIDKFWIPNKIDLVIYNRINEPELIEHINRVGKTIFGSSNKDNMIDKNLFIVSPEVIDFVSWCSRYINSKQLPFDSRFTNLIQAYKKYNWENEDFDDTYSRFQNFNKELNNYLLKDDLDKFQSSLKEILEWGGVIRGNLKSINKIDKEKRLEYFRNVKQILDDLNKLKSITKKEIENLNIISTSGFSKIYSALNMNYVIYDSRVSYAICSFIREYHTKEKPSSLDLLILAHGDRSSTKNRNPNPNKYTKIFPGYTGNYFSHFDSMVKTTWILELLAENPKSLNIQSTNNSRLWALQSALFVIGGEDKSKI